MKKDDWGVHQTHCCFKHGCKYGYDAIQKECPVYVGKIKQEYPCESCDNDSSIKLFFGCYIEISNAVAKIAEVKKTKSKYCLNEKCLNKGSLMAKYSVCPYCGSNIDFKDFVKIEYPTETNLGLTDTWEVVEVREYPEVKKLYFFKKELLDKAEFSQGVNSYLSVIETGKFPEMNYIESEIEVEKFNEIHKDSIFLLKENFSNVKVKHGLIAFPTKHYDSY